MMTSVGATSSNNKHEVQPFLRGGSSGYSTQTTTTNGSSTGTHIRDMFLVALTIVGIIAIANNNQLLFRTDNQNHLEPSPSGVGSEHSIMNNMIPMQMQMEPDDIVGAAPPSLSVSQVALEESYGLMNDVTNDGWKMLKDRVHRQRMAENRTPLKERIPKDDANAISTWYGKHFEPEFTCLHEERTGGAKLKGNGDGAKWVCNPRRIKELAQERLQAGEDKPCLIYSIGSKGQFDFEQAMVSLTSDASNSKFLCEIHVFDMDDYTDKLSHKYDGTIFYHKWGLTSNAERKQEQQNMIKTGLRRHLQEEEREYRSLQEIIKELGHEGRVIDVFKIDCEGCEWRTYQDWLSSNVEIRQIQVEVHNVQQNTVNFFVDIQDAGFVIFHKEPNTLPSKAATCIEYSFLKLSPSFFQY